MRSAIVIVLCLFCILLGGVVSAQSPRTASPPITPVQLTGFEAPPPGIPLDIFYGGLGGGGGINVYIPPAPTWAFTPGVMTFPGSSGYFSACGYRSATPPQGTLTSPSGHISTVTPRPFEDAGVRCFDYELPFSYGVELGLYTLTFAHPEGTLSHTFGLEYPDCWSGVRTGSVEWVMGLEPNQQITVYFYSQVNRPGGGNFVAQRTARADASGVLALDIQVTRTAPFTREDIFFIPTGIGRTFIDYTPGLSSFEFADFGFTLSTMPAPPTYPHNSLGIDVYRGADVRGRSCDGEFGTFAQVYSADGRTVSLTSQPNGGSAITALRSGDVVEILEYRALLTDGRAYAWKQVITESGVVGWTRSSDFIPIYPNANPGVRARLEPAYRLENGAHRTIPQTLYRLDGSVLGQFNAGTAVTLIQPVNDLWRVRLNDGTIAQLAAFDSALSLPTFTPLPWAAVLVSDAGQPVPSSVVCAGSPPPRLTAGGRGRVTPGDPNNIRAEPESGRVIGQIPAGSTFRVLTGPICGSTNRLTWWQVEYNGITGWTAEGRSGEYWLEPAG